MTAAERPGVLGSGKSGYERLGLGNVGMAEHVSRKSHY